MSDSSAIEWTDATWNPVRGCTKVSPGCKHCYAETFAERWRGIKGHPFEQGFDLRLVPEKLNQPLRWKKPRKIFVNSMSDLFHEEIPNEYIAAVFGVMAACPQHTFQILTKRADRLPRWFEWLDEPQGDDGGWPLHVQVLERHLAMAGVLASIPSIEWPLPNVHLGVSCEDQQRADERIPHLLAAPAAVRWVSAEPLLGPIDFGKKGLGQGSDCAECGWMVRVDEDGCCAHCGADVMWYGLDWVVAGGESGPGARPCDVTWIRSIVAQCKAAEVPVFTKQLGARPETRRTIDDINGRPFVSVERLRLKSSKGGDPSEWPAGEWPREMPR